MQKIKTFFKEDPDAITVDWIVMTASVIGIVIVVVASLQAGSEGLAAQVIDRISSTERL